MRKELQQTELIELYLLGQMNENDKIAFEAKMQNDEELAEEVKLQSLLMESVLLSAFSADMKTFHTKFASAPRPFFGKNFWYSLSGLIVLIGLGTGYYFLANDRTDRNAEIQSSVVNHSEIASSVNVKPSNSDLTVSLASEIKDQPDNEEQRIAPARLNKNQRRTRVLKDNESFVDINRFLPVEHKVTMDADMDFTFQMADSRSFVRVPAKAMISKSGAMIHGPVEIRYKEYRNSAQIAFSKIPMTYKDRADEYNFNSAGMFEIRAYQDGEELKLLPEKPIVVDYNVTKRLDNCFFWQLENNKWVKKQAIDFVAIDEANAAEIKKQEQDSVDQINRDVKIHSVERKDAGKVVINVKSTSGDKLEEVMIKKKERDYKWSRMYNITYTDSGLVAVNMYHSTNELKIYKKGYKTLLVRDVNVSNGEWTTVDAKLQPRQKRGFFAKVNRALASKEKEAQMKVKGSAVVKAHAGVLPLLDKDSTSETISKKRVARPKQVAWAVPEENVKGNATLLRGGGDAGHTYPDMVRGLNCPEFGVYNCDQIYRVQDQLAIKAEYRDEDGDKIGNGKVLSMVDLNYNGAFSFDPQQFKCARDGKNVLLLFTENKKIYAIKEEEFKAMNIDESGAYTFTMKDISAEVKDSDDLKKFLGL